MKPLQLSDSFVVPTTDGKLIEEHFGIASDGNRAVSIARMIAPPHWDEPFQTPEFDEYTYVVRGKMECTAGGEVLTVEAGQAIKIAKHTRIRYANPFDAPCEYLAICTPAFSEESAHREKG